MNSTLNLSKIFIILVFSFSFSFLKSQEHHNIVIVGAGISGLTSGYYLKDKDIVILEKQNSVGGRTISGVRNNFSYAKGTEYLGLPEDHLAEMLTGLGLTPKEIPSPMDAYFDGTNFYYGSGGLHRYFVKNSSNTEYKNFVQLLLNAYSNYDEIPNTVYDAQAQAFDNMTAKQWFANNGISDLYSKKYNVASRGLFGASLDDISALSFIPEASFDYDTTDLYDLTPEDLSITPEEEYANALAEKSGSYTFPKGLTEITNKIAEVLGSKIRLNSNVSSVTKQGDQYIITYKDASNNNVTLTSDAIVLAVPAPIALMIAPTVFSQEQANVINQIKFSSYATVALFSDTPIFDKAFDLAVPDTYFFTDIYDSTWVQKFYGGKKASTDNIMSVYIAPQTYTDHSLDTMSDQDLINSVYTDLNKVFPGASSKITGYDIQRFPYAYPVMTLGAYNRLLQFDDLNKGSLVLAGDGMIYPTFESAVESGYLASQRINAFLNPTLSTVENQNSDMKIFPNPFSDEFYITFGKDFKKNTVKVNIVNSAGENIYQNQYPFSRSIKVSLTQKLPIGEYFVKVENSNSVKTFKLLKK